MTTSPSGFCRSELVIGLHRDDVRAQPPRLAHDGPGLDAETLGGVAGGNGDGGIRQRLHDDDRLAAQDRGLLLLARRKEGVEIEEQPLDGRLGIVHLVFYSRRRRFCKRWYPSGRPRGRKAERSSWAGATAWPCRCCKACWQPSFRKWAVLTWPLMPIAGEGFHPLRLFVCGSQPRPLRLSERHWMTELLSSDVPEDSELKPQGLGRPATVRPAQAQRDYGRVTGHGPPLARNIYRNYWSRSDNPDGSER